MASQQAQFAETIRAMKLAMKRKADDYDSDTSIHGHTNRGNKLRRGASTVREGRLDTIGGSAYRKQVSHAGYLRNTIATNPPLYDEDGDAYSGNESDAENNNHAAPLEDNAFGEVQLETLLRPLTSPSALAEHPSLSLAYKSKALTDLTKQAEEMVRKERAKLWTAKRLLRRFLGDAEWVPCGVFETEQDEALLVENEVGTDELGMGSALESVLNDEIPEIREDGVGGVGGEEAKPSGEDMEGVEATDKAAQATAEDAQCQARQDTNGETTNPAQPNGEAPTTEDAPQPAQDQTSLEHPTLTSLRPSPHPNPEANSSASSTSGRDTNAPSHSMTTRRAARAQSPSQPNSRSPSPADSTVPPINPWFLAPNPTTALPLPTREADTTRQLLLLYVQKQEHSVRLLSTLYEGLQRAERLRHEVYRAAKADAHTGELSDGEDWYDVEDWGLGRSELKLGMDGVWGLEKGKDEVDELAGVNVEEEGRRGGRGRRRAVRI